MSAAVGAALKKIAIYILGDEKKRGKLFVAVGSITAGFLGLMCLPVAVLSSLGSMEIEPPEIDKSLFNESAWYESLDSQQQAQITNLQNQGQAVRRKQTRSKLCLKSETTKYVRYWLIQSVCITNLDKSFLYHRG